jgi:MauM/NapG family ferredoxin protein
VSKRRPTSRAAWVRRGVQLACLALFLVLLLWTRPVPGQPPPAWLGVLFYLDPLILLLTALAAHAVPLALLLALITVVVTVVAGRVFCGWFCPLGTVHALASRVFDYWRPRRRREHWSRWHLAKYYALAGLVVLALGGVQWLAPLDPFALLYRSITTAVWPGVQWAVEDASAALYHADPRVGSWRVTSASEPVYRWVRDATFVVPQQAFVGGSVILAVFLATLGLNYFRRRFWCRYVCPLGGLLGLLAWRPWLRRRVDEAACNQCDVCGLTCHGAATAAPGTGWKPQECFGCLNCTDACPRDGLAFTLTAPWQARQRDESIDLSRRGLLAGALCGAAGVLMLRTTPAARGRTFEPTLLRPPGAGAERDFLARCIGCGLCMKICPTGGLQPTWLEAGLEGLWTPVLVPRLGYCDYECNRCGEVCPTGAITPLPLEEKKQVRLGLAAFDRDRCIPYAFGRNCMVCEEHCPVPDKAIFFEERTVVVHGGETRTVLRPHVDADRCIGCGICEHVCPFKDRPAIRVTSANESRHPDNQPILPGGYGGYG